MDKIVVKRYINRKYYIVNPPDDFQAKKSYSLKDIKDFILKNYDVDIFIHNTHENITLNTLVRMIYRNEKYSTICAPKFLLIDIIKQGGIYPYLLSKFEKNKDGKIDFNRKKD